MRDLFAFIAFLLILWAWSAPNELRDWLNTVSPPPACTPVEATKS